VIRNKRIAAFLFVWFLEKNGLLYRSNGFRRLADNALVALTLTIEHLVSLLVLIKALKIA
jgi:hypothetical protein